MPDNAVTDFGKPDTAGVLFAVALVGGLGLAALLERVAVVTWDALPLALVIPAVLAAPALVAAAATRRRRAVAVWAVGLSAVLALYVLPWHPRKQFVWDLYSIRPGMSVAEVEAVMGGYIKGAGRKWGGDGGAAYPAGEAAGTATGTMTYRWNATDWEYDADWGQVEFAAGRVVGVRFLGD